MKKILLMCLNDPSGDPRPRRFIDMCNRMGCAVSLASYQPAKEKIQYEQLFVIDQKPSGRIANILRHITLGYSVLARWVGCSDKYLNTLANKRFYLDRLRNKLDTAKFDLIIVEDLQLMPVAVEINNGAPIIFDVREYYPKQREDSLFFRIVEKPERTRLCRLFLHRCSVLFTVSEGLAKEYKREFGVDMKVLLSVPRYREIPVKPCDEDKIRIVHHGVANYNRKIENMIEVLKRLDHRFTLDFYMTGDAGYTAFLKKKAGDDRRITFHDPVPFSQLINTISQYDIGFFYVEPTTFNLTHCLPNKFFEYVQARLVLAIGPSPDMRDIVLKHQFGIVAGEFSLESMTESLQRLTAADINKMKHNSDVAARELCFEVESEKVNTILNELLFSNETVVL